MPGNMHSTTEAGAPSQNQAQGSTSQAAASPVHWLLLGQIVTRVKGIGNRVHSTPTRDSIQLPRDPGNMHDRNAITVLISTGQNLGNINSQLAAILAALMDSAALRLQGKTVGKRGSRWTWMRPDICVQLYGRSGMVTRAELEEAGVVFKDDFKVSSSSDESD
ncbi:hypothetical protein IFR04_012329 [Cadophora malorum]|uniref:HIRAN domain-containing protein n=1 Tax=Cadophora malorum TaxID=108018 RepID=A0A8H7T964_9HELO|nr:hypothetical protein IFR04_012329 [Cadophora malorum]